MTAPSSGAVTITRLELQRIAGVSTRTAFSLDDLPAGLVLIHGPNGCGKSTSAAAMQALLWPEAKSDSYLDLRATVRQADDRWDLDIRGHQVVALQGANPVPHPSWAVSELRQRYHWSLQTLLEGNDHDLASALAAEMAGGIDFQALSSTLGWDRDPSAPHKLYKHYQEAEKQLDALRKEQEALRKESAELDTLQRQRAQAAATFERLPRITDALDLLEKSKQAADLKRQLDLIPEGATHFQPGDEERAVSLAEKIQRSTEELNTIATQREEQRTRDLLPNAPASEEDLHHLRRSLDSFETAWRDLIRERQRSTEDVAATQRVETQLRKRLGLEHPDASGVDGYDLPEIRSWAETVFASYEAEALETTAREALMLDPEDALPDPEQLTDLLSALRKARATDSRITLLDHIPFLLCWLLLAALLFVLADEQDPRWLPALLPASLLFLFCWKPLRQRLLFSQCKNLLPKALDGEEVSADSLLSLTRKAEQLQDEPRRRAEWQARVQEKEDLETRLSEAQTVLNNLGVHPGPGKEWIRNFLEDLQAWRKSTDDLSAAEAVLEEQEKALDQHLESLKACARQAGESLTQDDPLMDAASLRERIEDKLDQLQTLRTLEVQETNVRKHLQDAEQERDQMAARLRLDPPAPEAVKRLQGQHAEWEASFRRSEVVAQRVSELRKILEEADPELLTLEEPALMSLKTESEAAADTEADLRDRISRLKQRIDSAGSGRAMHDALEAVADSRQELEAERERHSEILAGRALLDWLRDTCRTQEQPELLQEANRLLTIFTNGSLQLTLDLQEGGNEFRASRPGQEPRSLHHLSTGEQTQVRMAARLAFLSKHERAPMPLLIDEALGTSDDERSTAIMQALLKVVAEGRQVFYFTAQTDEVAKWKKELEQHPDVPHRIIDLHALRSGSPVTPIQLPAEPAPANDPARKPGESKADWAERLGVPAWTGHDPIESLPLFLLMDQEEDALTACLRYGITTWGSLQSLINADAASMLPDGLAGSLQARATVLEALAHVWRIGRPPPVDPATVLDSGIVSDAFSDDILKVLTDCHHDAATFLNALENKAVPRWRQDNTDQLRSLFYEQGTLTDEEPLTEEDIRSRALISLKGRSDLEPDTWNALTQILF